MAINAISQRGEQDKTRYRGTEDASLCPRDDTIDCHSAPTISVEGSDSHFVFDSLFWLNSFVFVYLSFLLS